MNNQCVSYWYWIIAYTSMSKPQKHASLKKLSAHTKTKGSSGKVNESLSRKCISGEK